MFFRKIFKALIFWVVFAGSLWVFHYLRAVGVNPVAAVLGVTVGSIVVIAILELLVPFRPDWSWRTDRQAPNDLIHGLMLSVAGPRLGEALIGTSIIGAAAFLAEMTGEGIWPQAWPLWAQLGLAILIADFFDWGKHWAYHNLPVAWWVHALHHDVDRLHVFKGARLHFLEATVRYAVIAAPLIVLGAGAEILLWYAIFVNALGNLNHSNIDLPMPGFMHYLFQTPQNHRLHHERDPDLGRSNLSAVTMLPDLLFGTFRHPRQHPLQDVGIDDSPIPGNLFGQLLAPLAWPLFVWRRKRAVSSVRRIADTAAILALITLVVPIDATAQTEEYDQTSIDGEWATQGFGSKIQIGACVDDGSRMCGIITWLWEPTNEDGQVILDTKNPDTELRKRPLLGVDILQGFAYDAEHGDWRGGRIYNPEDGRSYRAMLRPRNETTLEVTGCAARVFCQTQIWRRASILNSPDGDAEGIRNEQ